MKSISLSYALAAATLFLLQSFFVKAAGEEMVTQGLPAPSSEDAPAKKDRKQQKPGDADILKRFDKNGDGKLDDDEKAAAKMEMRKGGAAKGAGAAQVRERAVKRFDKNGDGKLDEAEAGDAVKALAVNPAFVQRFDKNGDGILDEEEKATAQAGLSAGSAALLAGAGKSGKAGAGRPGEQLMKRFDKDGDGQLSEAERIEAFEAMSKNPMFVKRFDKDGDGVLSETEKTAAIETMRQRGAGKKAE